MSRLYLLMFPTLFICPESRWVGYSSVCLDLSVCMPVCLRVLLGEPCCVSRDKAARNRAFLKVWEGGGWGEGEILLVLCYHLFYVRFSVYLSVYLSIYQPTYLFIHLSINLSGESSYLLRLFWTKLSFTFLTLLFFLFYFLSLPQHISGAGIRRTESWSEHQNTPQHFINSLAIQPGGSLGWSGATQCKQERQVIPSQHEA